MNNCNIDAIDVADSPFASGGKLCLHRIQKIQLLKQCGNSIHTNSLGPNLLAGFRGGVLSIVFIKKGGVGANQRFTIAEMKISKKLVVCQGGSRRRIREGTQPIFWGS